MLILEAMAPHINIIIIEIIISSFCVLVIVCHIKSSCLFFRNQGKDRVKQMACLETKDTSTALQTREYLCPWISSPHGKMRWKERSLHWRKKWWNVFLQLYEVELQTKRKNTRGNYRWSWTKKFLCSCMMARKSKAAFAILEERKTKKVTGTYWLELSW